MAGEIQIGGTSFASESGGTITVNNGTIGSGVTFPAGHVLNVVNNTKTGIYSTTSTSYVDVTDYSASITPSSASNKVLILINAQLSGSATAAAGIAVYAGASLVTETRTKRVASVDYYASISYEHSPSTTSEVTYQIKIKSYSGTVLINQDSGMTSYITLMEIAG
jgi:hypothetical protein